MILTAYNNVLHNNASLGRSPDTSSIDYGMVTGGIR